MKTVFKTSIPPMNFYVHCPHVESAQTKAASMRAFFIGPVFQLNRRALHVTEANPRYSRRNWFDRSSGAFCVKCQNARTSRRKIEQRSRRHAGSWTSGAMTGPGHGRIRAFAMDGNSEDASLRAPGRNERRSAGHGKRRAPRCRAVETNLA